MAFLTHQKVAPGADKSNTLMCSIEVPTAPLPHPWSFILVPHPLADSRKQKEPMAYWQLVKLVVPSIASPSGAFHSAT